MSDYENFFIILLMFLGFICVGVGISSLLCFIIFSFCFIIFLFLKNKLILENNRNKRIILYVFMVIGFISSALLFVWIVLSLGNNKDSFIILLIFLGFICAGIPIGALLGFIISLFFKSKYHKRKALYTSTVIGFISSGLFFGWLFLQIMISSRFR